MSRVLFVVMPFSGLDRPALGVSTLAADVERRGRHQCDVRYLSFLFADLVGVTDYSWLESSLPYEALAGEWLFSEALYGSRPEVDAGYFQEVLFDTYQLSEADQRRLLGCRSRATHFIESCASLVSWSDYDVVGFTSTFQQNIASIALAARVKAHHPRLTIVFGGANWEGEMGVALLERFPFVDACCSGEADASLPTLLDALEESAAPIKVAGVSHRSGARVVSGPPDEPVENMDSLPIPDFSAYFAALETSPSGLGVLPRLLLETARGCWWGARSHCTFCGLNGDSMAFRSKSPERALDELRSLHARYQTTTVSVVDNILDMRYFRTVLPELEAEGPGLDLFWEVKANLSREQLRQLGAAGVHHVQPGIESLSDDVLERLRKGTDLMRNVQMLKWAREYGVNVEWNLLFGAPGEAPHEYEAIARTIEKITHLDPPGACGPVRLDRFSPYHRDPASFGMTDVRPMAPYKYLYDVSPADLQRIAYYFDFDYADAQQPMSYVAPALAAAKRWKDSKPGGGLWAVEGIDDGLTIVDERVGRRRRTATIDGWKAAIYRFCDRARARDELAELSALEGVDRSVVDEFLERCVVTDVMLLHRSRYLSLAVHRPPRASVQRPMIALVASNG